MLWSSLLFNITMALYDLTIQLNSALGFGVRHLALVREQIPVKIDSMNLPQVGLLVQGCLTHKQDDRFLVGHGHAHSRNPPEILLQPLYPVRGVDK